MLRRCATGVVLLAVLAALTDWRVAAATAPAVLLICARRRRRQGRRRARVVLRDIMGPPERWVCTYCAGRADTWDHVTPRSAGGPDTPDNLVPACRPCNSSKGDTPLEEWLTGRRGGY